MEVAMRFLDVFFYEGGKFLFKVALAIFGIHHNTLLQITDPPKMMLVCRSLPEATNDANVLIRCANDKSLEFLTERKIRELRSAAAKIIQARKEAKMQEDLQRAAKNNT